MPDIAGDSSTTSNVTIGSVVISAIDVSNDHDWFRIELVAGQSVTIRLNSSGTNPLGDPYLRLRNSSGTMVAENDDSGEGLNSQLTFTATTTGTYYIDAAAWQDSSGQTSTGEYTLQITHFTPPPVGTITQLASQLTHGYWDGASHHFNVTQGGSLTVNLTGLAADGQNLARLALRQWSDVIGVTFVETSSLSAQIMFDDNETGAFSTSSYSNGITTSARVNVSAQWLIDSGNTVGSYGYQTYVHEIGHALGLGHAGNYNTSADYPGDARYLNDSWPMSIMSYFSVSENSYFSNLGFTPSYLGTPMLADIAAMSVLYGLSTTTRAGATTYGFNSNAGDIYNATLFPRLAYTIFDSGGIDTLDYSGFSQNQRIDLNPGNFSNIGGRTGNVTIAIGTVIENAVGGAGDDSLSGNSIANVLYGGAGNDVLFGAGGNNLLYGGSGIDTAEFGSARAANVVVAFGQAVAVFNTITHQTDRTFEIEALRFQDGGIDTNLLTQFVSLDYIAGYDDLIRSFGADAEAGFLHFAYNGVFEGRVQDGFNGFEYLASYGDLISAFGANEDAAARHFVSHGFSEGRDRDSFDGIQYIASYGDLITAFGANEDAAARHFVSHGFSEGRDRDSFDGIQYIASYGDLISAFGANEDAAAQHFVSHGFSEGRSRDEFDAAVYLEKYADLRAAFGDDHYAATVHYINHGYFEGRTDILI